MVAGNHEFDGRELGEAWSALRTRCESLGITLLERESRVLADAAGARIRFCGHGALVRSSICSATPAAPPRQLRRGHYMRIMRSNAE